MDASTTISPTPTLPATASATVPSTVPERVPAGQPLPVTRPGPAVPGPAVPGPAVPGPLSPVSQSNGEPQPESDLGGDLKWNCDPNWDQGLGVPPSPEGGSCPGSPADLPTINVPRMSDSNDEHSGMIGELVKGREQLAKIMLRMGDLVLTEMEHPGQDMESPRELYAKQNLYLQYHREHGRSARLEQDLKREGPPPVDPLGCSGPRSPRENMRT